MADISVDLDALEAFGGRLDGIKHALDSSRDVISGYDGSYGDNRVQDAMHHFEKHWRDGRKHVENTAETLASMAIESVKGFRKADDDLKKTLLDGMQQQQA